MFIHLHELVIDDGVDEHAIVPGHRARLGGRFHAGVRAGRRALFDDRKKVVEIRDRQGGLAIAFGRFDQLFNPASAIHDGEFRVDA